MVLAKGGRAFDALPFGAGTHGDNLDFGVARELLVDVLLGTYHEAEPTIDALFGKCPYATAQRLLQGKWTIMIPHVLSEGPVRFNEIRRQLMGINHATLSRQLKQMEADGLVKRTEYEGVVQRVDYELTGIGKRFIPVLDDMKVWSEEYIKGKALG